MMMEEECRGGKFIKSFIEFSYIEVIFKNPAGNPGFFSYLFCMNCPEYFLIFYEFSWIFLLAGLLLIFLDFYRLNFLIFIFNVLTF